MIGIIDYGMGNLRSVQKALQRVGAEAVILRDPAQASGIGKLILPGIGAAADAMRVLRERGWVEVMSRQLREGRTLFGICLGLQLLFEESLEGGRVECLGLLRGQSVRFDPRDPSIKVPHMGWNSLRFVRPDCPLLTGLDDGCSVYFVHGYHVVPSDPSVIVATSDHGGRFCAIVQEGNLYGAQFHPEKSQSMGLRMLANFAGL